MITRTGVRVPGLSSSSLVTELVTLECPGGERTGQDGQVSGPKSAFPAHSVPTGITAGLGALLPAR